MVNRCGVNSEIDNDETSLIQAVAAAERRLRGAEGWMGGRGRGWGGAGEGGGVRGQMRADWSVRAGMWRGDEGRRVRRGEGEGVGGGAQAGGVGVEGGGRHVVQRQRGGGPRGPGSGGGCAGEGGRGQCVGPGGATRAPGRFVRARRCRSGSRWPPKHGSAG